MFDGVQGKATAGWGAEEGGAEAGECAVYLTNNLTIKLIDHKFDHHMTN